VQDPDKQKECEELLGPLGDSFHNYVACAKLITDFVPEGDAQAAPEDDEFGVAVDLDEDDDSGRALPLAKA